MREHRSRSYVAVALVGTALLAWGVASAAAGKPTSRTPCIVTPGVTFAKGSNTIYGTAGDDEIDCRGSRKEWNIYSGGGRDKIHGGERNDVIYGGFAQYGNGGADVIYGGPGACGDITITCYGGTDSSGGAGDDQYVAVGGGAHSFFGGSGNDTIDLSAAGGTSINEGFGEEGNDSIIGSPHRDQLNGGDGDDTIHAGAGDDAVSGGPGFDDLGAGDGDDVIYGGGDSDRMYGEGGADSLEDDSAVVDYFDGGADAGQVDACTDADEIGIVENMPAEYMDDDLNHPDEVQNDEFAGCEFRRVF